MKILYVTLELIFVVIWIFFTSIYFELDPVMGIALTALSISIWNRHNIKKAK